MGPRYVLWATAAAMICCGVLLVWRVVGPYWRGRAAIVAVKESDEEVGVATRRAIEMLGGDDEAAKCLGLYFRIDRVLECIGAGSDAGELDDRAVGVVILHSGGNPGFREIVDILQEGSVGAREAAAVAVAEAGPEHGECVPELVAATRDASGEALLALISALGSIGWESTSAVPRLRALADTHQRASVRQAAREALQKIKKAQEEKNKSKQPVDAPAK